MFVPYMDPAATWSFRSYMDIGEYGFGLLATQLRPGQDCPAGATFLDLTIADARGEPVALKGVVCLFERPSGDPLWRHDEAFNGTFEMRANTELVVRMAPVVGNYDYLVDYVFDRAGDIDVRLGAYGIDETKGVASSTLADPTAAADTAYGTLVAQASACRQPRSLHGVPDRHGCGRDRQPAGRGPHHAAPDLHDGPRRSLWQVESHPIAVEGPVTTPLNAAQFRVESAAAGMRRVIRPATSLSRDTPTPRSSRPTTRSRFARDSRPIRCGPAPMRRASASPPAPIRTKIRKPTACRNGWRRSVRSMAAISCSGTRSASGTCRAPKTGRRCRGSGTVSDCGRSISSTEAPRSTYRRSMRRRNEMAADTLRDGGRIAFAADNPRADNGAESALPDNSSAPAGVLLYLDQSQWRQADPERKDRARDRFHAHILRQSRHAAVDPRRCLDEAGDSGSMFERALSCVATRPLPSQAGP